MHRFYADETGIRDGLAALTREDAAHAARVLRLRAGDMVELISGGERHQARLLSVTPEAALAQVVSALPSTEPRLRLTLYQGLPKADKLELIIQKAVELGAAAVTPVAMTRCVTRLDPADAAKKLPRWQRIAREACKQSGRCVEPEIRPPIPFSGLLAELGGYDGALVPWEEDHNTSLTAFHRQRPDAGSLAVVIGPEGGITPEEIDRLRQEGCVPVTLGPRILRTETAGLCAISALMCLYGEMEH